MYPVLWVTTKRILDKPNVYPVLWVTTKMILDKPNVEPVLRVTTKRILDKTDVYPVLRVTTKLILEWLCAMPVRLGNIRKILDKKSVNLVHWGSIPGKHDVIDSITTIQYNSQSRGRAQGVWIPPPPIRPDACLRLKLLRRQVRISLF